jgi:small subunit ribosomal protein S13
MFSLFENKCYRILKNLKLIYGVGHTRALRFHRILGLNLRVGTLLLTRAQQRRAHFFAKRITTNQRLKEYIQKVMEFSYEIQTYRGLRNKCGLPARGQQTRTNAKTKKKFHL